MLVLSRRIRHRQRTADNCLVFDLPDGGRVRVWLVERDRPTERAPDGCDEVKVLIDAPRSVVIHRGEHVPADAAGKYPREGVHELPATA